MFHLVLESHDGRALGADSEEKHEPVSDIDTVLVDCLKALDPERPIREAIVALARRLAVIMHRIWVDGTEFRWTREQAPAAA